MTGEHDFQRQLSQQYTDFEDALDEKEPNELRQLWHTPAELFSPHYGEVIARYLLDDYAYNLYPYQDLIVYELGAGNGTMMLNILDYVRAVRPAMYARMHYKIVEVSSALAALQAQGLKQSASARGHAPKVEIINRSIFDWDSYVASPCYILALEVFDNFAHDAIKYRVGSGAPLQSTVIIDHDGDMFEHYTDAVDAAALRFLERRQASCSDFAHPLLDSKRRGFLRSRAPAPDSLSQAEYIPTRLMQFFQLLYDMFPRHKLVASDFHRLPDAVAGLNAPVVQTRYRREMIAVTTPLVRLVLLGPCGAGADSIAGASGLL